MTDTPQGAEEEIEVDIEEIAARLGRLSLTPAPTPSKNPTISYCPRFFNMVSNLR